MPPQKFDTADLLKCKGTLPSFSTNFYNQDFLFACPEVEAIQNVFTLKRIGSYRSKLFSYTIDPNAELQIRGSIEDNSKTIFLISQQKHVVTPHKNRLSETVLMMGHNKGFKGVIRKIIP